MGEPGSAAAALAPPRFLSAPRSRVVEPAQNEKDEKLLLFIRSMLYRFFYRYG
jgi:hypothetical protein